MIDKNIAFYCQVALFRIVITYYMLKNTCKLLIWYIKIIICDEFNVTNEYDIFKIAHQQKHHKRCYKIRNKYFSANNVYGNY